MEMAEQTPIPIEPYSNMRDVDEPETDSRRVRTLTSKGQGVYEEHLQHLKNAYNQTWCRIDDIMYAFDGESGGAKYLRATDSEVCDAYKALLANSRAIILFLNEARTESSLRETNTHETQLYRRTELVKRFRNQIESLLLSAAEAHSEKLESQANSIGELNQASSFVVKKQLASSAEKAQLKFLDKEIELQKQRAIADIELKALERRKKSAVADAEVRVVENLEPIFKDNFSDVRSIQSLRQVKNERVAEYIAKSHDDTPLPRNEQINESHFSVRPERLIPDKELSASMQSLCAPAAQLQSSEVRHENSQSLVRDLSKFLLKKDLLMLRLIAFKDTAQHYSVWKASFQSIISELNASPMEELDLLTKWLGPDSKEFAISMRATNIANPGRALQLIWIRLEQMYGRAETKERELSDKVAAFPVLTDSHADRIKYLRLVDLLCEIESVMNDERYANLLCYFNSSKGVLPITQKLPRSISEKWAIRASQYKTRNKVPYPPFSFCVQFMREVSERKIDPSFYSADAETKSLVKTEPRQRLIRNLNARKVNIDSGDMLQPEGSDISSAKRCPIHKAPHALTACRSFNAMTLNQKRDYLKSNNLCFNCCNGKHLANKCHSNVKCEVFQ